MTGRGRCAAISSDGMTRMVAANRRVEGSGVISSATSTTASAPRHSASMPRRPTRGRRTVSTAPDHHGQSEGDDEDPFQQGRTGESGRGRTGRRTPTRANDISISPNSALSSGAGGPVPGDGDRRVGRNGRFGGRGGRHHPPSRTRSRPSSLARYSARSAASSRAANVAGRRGVDRLVHDADADRHAEVGPVGQGRRAPLPPPVPGRRRATRPVPRRRSGRPTARCTARSGQHRRDLLQHRVAVGVPEPVVELFEVVDVQQQCADPAGPGPADVGPPAGPGTPRSAHDGSTPRSADRSWTPG